MRAIRYGGVLREIIFVIIICFNPLCVQLDMVLIPASVGASGSGFNPLCVQLDMVYKCSQKTDFLTAKFQSAVRAIRYGVVLFSLLFTPSFCFNPLCVQLDMVFNGEKAMPHDQQVSIRCACN